MNFLKNLALATALTGSALFVPAAWAQDPTPVESVTVESDVTAIANERAAAYWGNVSADLQAAILSRVADRVADKGTRITIDIDELALTNSFATAIGAADSVLVGKVRISSDDNSKFDAYDVAVNLDVANRLLPEGVVAASSMTDTPEHYAALISAFADTVVSRLK